MQKESHKHIGTQDLFEVRPHHKVVPSNITIVEMTTKALESLSTPPLSLTTTKIKPKISLEQMGDTNFPKHLTIKR